MARAGSGRWPPLCPTAILWSGSIALESLGGKISPKKKEEGKAEKGEERPSEKPCRGHCFRSFPFRGLSCSFFRFDLHIEGTLRWEWCLSLPCCRRLSSGPGRSP